MTTDHPAPIWVRLTITTVGTALLGVITVTLMTIAFSYRYVDRLVTERQNDLANLLVVEAASSYNTGRPGWGDVDLRPGLHLASQSGSDVAVADQQGKIVATTFSDPRRTPGATAHPILVDGVRVGTLYVRFNGRGLVPEADQLRSSLLHAVVSSAGVAAILALGVGLLGARRLSQPVRQLTSTAAALARDTRGARVGAFAGAPAESMTLPSRSIGWPTRSSVRNRSAAILSPMWRTS